MTVKKSALTVRDVALELNVSEATVRGWIAAKRLRAMQLDGSRKQPIIRILREDLDRYLEGSQTAERA